MKSRKLLAERITHERELREAQQAAVEEARKYQLATLEVRLDAMNQFRQQLTEQAKTFMPIARFERDHQILVERYEREHQDLVERVDQQERVTIRQDTTSGVLDKLATNNRWMIGILVTLMLFAATTILHVFNIL